MWTIDNGCWLCTAHEVIGSKHVGCGKLPRQRTTDKAGANDMGIPRLRMWWCSALSDLSHLVRRTNLLFSDGGTSAANVTWLRDQKRQDSHPKGHAQCCAACIFGESRPALDRTQYYTELPVADIDRDMYETTSNSDIMNQCR